MRSEADAIGVLFIERLASIVVAEVDMGISGGRDVDLFDGSSVNQRTNLGGIGPGRWQSCKNNASDLRRYGMLA